MKLCLIAGARPNFMKIAPIIEAINNYNHLRDKEIHYYLVHTGQHYDQQMSKLFFENLGIPAPDVNLEVGSASHAVQAAEIMKRFETICLKEKPTHLLVVGDVNSTIACALVASKLGIKIIHVEAGLRSFDRTMPEEINRVLTDAISDCLFTTEESANKNLRHEGIPENKIFFVGNVMIDTLLKHKQKAQQSNILNSLGLVNSQPNYPTNSSNPNNPVTHYAVLTLHRPSNVDNKQIFQGILDALSAVAKEIPIIFPIHPRTLNRIEEFEFQDYLLWRSTETSESSNPKSGIHRIEPLGYLDFLQLMSNSKLVLTDSGGIQEETTILGIPCVTMRDNTERPITVSQGTNVIAGVKKEKIIAAIHSQLPGETQMGSQPFMPTEKCIPPLWDGKAAERIVDVLSKGL